MKPCTKCGVVKPLDQFAKRRHAPDGRQYRCKDCFREYRKANREDIAAKKAAYYREHVEERQAYDAQYVPEYRQRRWEINQAYYAENHVACREAGRQHYAENKALYVGYATARKKHIRRATPPWADREAIQFFYVGCPEGCHVDHVIPLRGETVSGLHVAENLQWLPAAENQRKSNSFDNTEDNKCLTELTSISTSP